MAKGNEIRDTDLISLNRKLRDQLSDSLIESGGCLIVKSPHLRTLPVRLRTGHRYSATKHPKMQITRIAWAIANPRDHLTVDEYAVHICENTGSDGRPLCANGAHLRKGTKTDMQHAQALRAKGFFKEAA